MTLLRSRWCMRVLSYQSSSRCIGHWHLSYYRVCKTMVSISTRARDTTSLTIAISVKRTPKSAQRKIAADLNICTINCSDAPLDQHECRSRTAIRWASAVNPGSIPPSIVGISSLACGIGSFRRCCECAKNTCWPPGIHLLVRDRLRAGAIQVEPNSSTHKQQQTTRA